jgi:hypothetical protein
LVEKKNRKPIHTQWAGQFYVAAELARREYIVTFTLGNVPRTDLIATSPAGKSFRIECKSQKSSNFWLVGDVPEKPVYYIFVLVPLKDYEFPEFFIIPSKTVKQLVAEEIKRTNERGTNPATFKAGFPFSEVKPFKNAWHKLPK